MAEQMKDIKRRIDSISSIRQITNAMELVSTSKMRKAKLKLESTRPYYTTVVDNIGELLSITEEAVTPLTKVRDIKKRLYIVLSSDRGLAGGYSSNIARFAEQIVNAKDDCLLTVGAKARDYFVRRGYNITDSVINISESFDFSDAKYIAQSVLDMYKREEIDYVGVIYTGFKSALTQTPKVLNLLPASGFDKKEKRRTKIITYEPSPEVMLDYLVEEYVTIAIYGALIESSASEQAARMQSMKNATDSADDMIESWSMKYNRARQASITQELTEIVSGAEALN